MREFQLEKLQSLMNKEIFRSVFNAEEDTEMTDAFKFDAPTVRGPRKRAAPVEDKEMELPAKAYKLTAAQSVTESRNKEAGWLFRSKKLN